MVMTFRHATLPRLSGVDRAVDAPYTNHASMSGVLDAPWMAGHSGVQYADQIGSQTVNAWVVVPGNICESVPLAVIVPYVRTNCALVMTMLLKDLSARSWYGVRVGVVAAYTKNALMHGTHSVERIFWRLVAYCVELHGWTSVSVKLGIFIQALQCTSLH